MAVVCNREHDTGCVFGNLIEADWHAWLSRCVLGRAWQITMPALVGFERPRQAAIEARTASNSRSACLGDLGTAYDERVSCHAECIVPKFWYDGVHSCRVSVNLLRAPAVAHPS